MSAHANNERYVIVICHFKIHITYMNLAQEPLLQFTNLSQIESPSSPIFQHSVLSTSIVTINFSFTLRTLQALFCRPRHHIIFARVKH